jgi:hypothetical protein
MVGGFTFVSYLETMIISNCRRIDDAGVVVEQNPNGATVQQFSVGYAIFQVSAGRAGDTFGPRFTLTVAAITWFVAYARKLSQSRWRRKRGSDSSSAEHNKRCHGLHYAHQGRERD